MTVLSAQVSRSCFTKSIYRRCWPKLSVKCDGYSFRWHSFGSKATNLVPARCCSSSAFLKGHSQQTFSRRWVWSGGPVLCPPREPDLVLLDFFFWEYLTLVYGFTVNSPQELQLWINKKCHQTSANDVPQTKMSRLLGEGRSAPWTSYVTLCFYFTISLFYFFVQDY